MTARIIWFSDTATHYDDVIMTMLASQITSLTVVYSIVYSGVNQRIHQSSASLAIVREIHRGPVNFPHKWPVTRKMFPFDDVIMPRVNVLQWYIITSPMVLALNACWHTVTECCQFDTWMSTFQSLISMEILNGARKFTCQRMRKEYPINMWEISTSVHQARSQPKATTAT